MSGDRLMLDGAAGDTIVYRAIGLIRTPWLRVEDVPVQGAAAPDAEGRIEVHPDYIEGLLHIEGFDRLIVLYHFDQSGEVKLVRRPFLDDEPHGVFAMRHPARPNPIGLTVVSLTHRAETTLFVRGVDMLDGTPLLDVKPYVPRWDAFPDSAAGWLDVSPDGPKREGRE